MVLTMFASELGLIVLFTQRMTWEFGVYMFVYVRYNSTAENYLAGGWWLSAAWKEPPFFVSCLLPIIWVCTAFEMAGSGKCMYVCVLACLLDVIMCARPAGESMGAKAVFSHCSGTSSLLMQLFGYAFFSWMVLYPLFIPNHCFPPIFFFPFSLFHWILSLLCL